MECRQYHFSQATRLLHWCLWWHWIRERSVQFLIGCNPLSWINGGITQVSCPFFLFFCLFIMLSLAAESKSSLWLMSLALISFSDKQSATLVMCNSMTRHLNPEQKTKSQKLWLWRKIMSCFSIAYWPVFLFCQLLLGISFTTAHKTVLIRS